MGAQIVLCDGFEVVPPPDMNHLILFGNDQNGSYYDESTITTEEERNLFSGDSSPAGAAEEEWPEAKSFSFYFVKQPLYDDPEIKTKIDNADQEIYQCNKLRIDISYAQKLERAELSSLSAQMESSISNWEGYRVVSEAKKREFDTLEESLRNLWCSSSDQLCFSKEELDHLICRAHYHIEHGSNGLEDEHWVLKETEKPDGVMLSKDSLAEKEASIHRVKSMAVELNEVKKELDAITWKINHLNDKIGTSQKNIKILDVEMAHVLEKRDRSFERIKMLRLQRDKGNAAFFQSLGVIRKARNLAASANIKDLEVLASSEVDKFMDHWNNDKAFRDDYVKRVSFSLCERQLSRDGRIRDSPVQVVRGTQVPFKTLKGGEEVQKMNREDSSSSSNSSQGENVITDKQKKEGKKEVKNFNSSSAEESDVIDLEFPVYEKPKKEEEEEEEEEEEVDEETLKRREREEQIEKARLAMERKRKLQEKAAAKSAARAQKEAEKKLKDCEKKAKKKAAAKFFSPSKLDQSREVNQLEKVKNLAVSGKEKQQKERSLFPKQRSFRYKHRGRGTEALPKAILNRRKAQKYWVWGLSSAVLAFALVLVVLLLR